MIQVIIEAPILRACVRVQGLGFGVRKETMKLLQNTPKLGV